MSPLDLRPPTRSLAPRSASDLSPHLGATSLCFARSATSPFAAATRPSRCSNPGVPTNRRLGSKASVRLVICLTKILLARLPASICAEIAAAKSFRQADATRLNTSFPGLKHRLLATAPNKESARQTGTSVPRGSFLRSHRQYVGLIYRALLALA